MADTVFVTVIALGVTEMVTTVLTVAVLVTHFTSMLVLRVELMTFVLGTTDVLVMVLVMLCTHVAEKVSVLVVMVVNMELMTSVLVTTDVALIVPVTTVEIIAVLVTTDVALIVSVTTVEIIAVLVLMQVATVVELMICGFAATDVFVVTSVSVSREEQM